jgi:hypothetical protein
MWLMDVMSVGEVNDEGVPLDTIVNMRLSKVCGLAARQRVSITCSGSDHRMSLTTTSATPVMPENREIGNKRMKDWPSKILRIHTTNYVDGWDHLCVVILS